MYDQRSYTTCITTNIITTPVLKAEAGTVSGGADFLAVSDLGSPEARECGPRKCSLREICN